MGLGPEFLPLGLHHPEKKSYASDTDSQPIRGLTALCYRPAWPSNACYVQTPYDTLLPQGDCRILSLRMRVMPEGGELVTGHLIPRTRMS